MDRKVNCNVHNVADGSKHLVFTVEGTGECVGEIRYTGDENYLLTVSQMFSNWAHMVRPNLSSAIRGIVMNGKRRSHG